MPDNEFDLRSVPIENAQGALDDMFPAPEPSMNRLCKSVSRSADTIRDARVRRLVIEVDDLISQARWHLGQAIWILLRYPEVEEGQAKDDDPMEFGRGIPSSAHLLMRPWIRDPHIVLTEDLLEKRRGVTFAGWIYHMLIDDAIYRLVGVLDRIAAIVGLAGDVRFSNDRVYFRTKKLSVIHRHIGLPETQSLLDIASTPAFELILKYRDLYSHERKEFFSGAGPPPLDLVRDDLGQLRKMDNHPWSAEELLDFARTAYHLVENALEPAAIVCETLIPVSKSFGPSGAQAAE